jgi:hypothetical protein
MNCDAICMDWIGKNRTSKTPLGSGMADGNGTGIIVPWKLLIMNDLVEAAGVEPMPRIDNT